MTVTITFPSANVNTTKNNPVTVKAGITSDTGIKNIEWKCDKDVNFTTSLSRWDLNFNPSVDGVYTFTITVTDNNNVNTSKSVTVTVGSGTTTEPPTGTLLYDSNVDIDWANWNNKVIKIGSPYGDPKKPNTKYIRMNASGDPNITFLAPTKELVLQHNGDYGRAYFGVCNYACRMELDFKIDSCSANMSLKSRNRHQYNEYARSVGLPVISNPEGGQGGSIGCSETDADLEITHGGGEASGPQRSISPALVANKYYKCKFSQYDLNGKIHVKIELDRDDGQGFKVINEGDVTAPSQFFDKNKFLAWSEFWVRYNTSGGKLYFKNLKVYAL